MFPGHATLRHTATATTTCTATVLSAETDMLLNSYILLIHTVDVALFLHVSSAKEREEQTTYRFVSVRDQKLLPFSQQKLGPKRRKTYGLHDNAFR